MNTTPTTNEEAEERAFAEEVGSLIFQSALVRFIAEEEPATVASFETYVSTHAAEEDFLITLAAKFPNFQKFLTEEATLLENEIMEVTSAGNV